MNKKTRKKLRSEDIIRKAGFRATKPRVSILSFLQTSKYPLTIKEIGERLENRTVDQVTIYRILDAFKKAGIVNQIDFQDNSARYEYKDGERDHHHLICLDCRKVTDIAGCDYKKLSENVLKQAPDFAKVTAHSFEFFGMCNNCDRK